MLSSKHGVPGVKPSVLVVDDEPAIRASFAHYLSKAGFEVHPAGSIAEARGRLSTSPCDVVLLDLKLPDGDGLDYIIELREGFPRLAVVVITGTSEVSVAVEAMRRGADHFVTKPVNMADLEVFLFKGLELGTLRRQRRASQRLCRGIAQVAAASPAMREVLDVASLAAENDAPVLIRGETGTGKGVLAQWIHHHSRRRSGCFVDLNCSSMRGDLLASELFGHTRGAFTSALESREGLLEVADGGTLFLDEVGDMDLGVQALFLKVLEEHRFRRIGENQERRSDFRLICATNRDLEARMESGQFRRDLYFRIHVLPVVVPPLRDRPEDMGELYGDLLAAAGAPGRVILPPARRLLESYPWPGNVRELKNVLERAVLLARGAPLDAEHFPGLAEGGGPASLGTPGGVSTEDARRALDRWGGNARKAASALGISRATLYRRLKEKP